MSVPATQPTEEQLAAGAAISVRRLAEANVNPATGLATDYLNHFNEAIMLLEMLSSCSDCIDDFFAWQPKSYGEHFAASRFKGRHIAIAAYNNADPAARHCLETLADTMTTVIEATRSAMRSGLPPGGAQMMAGRAAAWLKPLVARAGAVINGETDGDTDRPAAPQAVVDGLMAG